MLAAASEDYRTENLVCVNFDGSVRWRAALPSNTGPDCFVNATVDENDIRADSWSGWAIWFDHETGVVKKSEFVK